jgi:DNA-directed RNA polymerase subunit RPC12/RpoP
MNYKTVGLISNILIGLGFVVSLAVIVLINAFDNLLPALIVAIVLIVAGIFVKYKFYNCPYCKKSLLQASNNGRSVDKCPHCGKKLD